MKICIFGAGIGGLSAAHRLAQQGHQVELYESKSTIGGLARTEGGWCDSKEVSWRVYFGFYKNLFSIMKEVPSYDGRAIIDHLVPFTNEFLEDDKFSSSILHPKNAYVALSSLLSSDNRLNSEDVAWRDKMKGGDKLNIPQWLGMDRYKGSFMSVWKVGIEYQQLSFKQNYVFDGPTNKVWFDPWVEYLKKMGVKIFLNTPLASIETDGRKVYSATLSSGEKIQCDQYVFSIPAEQLSLICSEIIPSAPRLAHLGYQIQVAFQFFLKNRLSFGRKSDGKIVDSCLLSESPWAIIIEAKDISWKNRGCPYAQWSVGICQADVVGVKVKKPFEHCTFEEVVEEIKAQMLSNESFIKLLKENNEGFDGENFNIENVTTMDTFKFDPTLQVLEPKFTNNVGTKRLRPHARVGTNAFVATAYTYEALDVFSMEGACIAGNQVAYEIGRVGPPHQPKRFGHIVLSPFRFTDDVLFRVGLPNVFIVLIILLVILLIVKMFDIKRKK